MPVITEIQFSHPRGALADTLSDCPGIGATVIGVRRTDPNHDSYLIRFDSTDDFDDSDGSLEQTLTDDRTVREASRMTRIDEQNLWSIAFTPETVLLSPVVTDAGGLVMDARGMSEPPTVGWHERWLLPDSDAVNTIWQHAREKGFDFEICELLDRSRIDATQPERQMITEPQREALQLAYREGYFSEPREASLADLAASLDHSPSAVGGRVRRGMKTLIGRTLVINDPDS